MTQSATSQASARPVAAAPRDYHFPRFTRHSLPNGLGIIVAPVKKLPLVTVLAVVDAGATVEPTNQQGIAALTARLLLEGAGALDGNALSDRIERIGASIESHADWDVTVTSLTVLRSRLTEALALMRDLLTQPTFPEREVARLKEERLAELLQQLTEPRTLADDRFSQALYEQGARYALPEAGDADGIRAIGREQIVAFHRARYQPSQVTLVFAGDITESDAIAMSEQLFGDWNEAGVPSAAEMVDATRSGRLVRVVGKTDAPQSELRVGHVGLRRNIADYFPTTVMNAVLGGLFSSRINLNLREVHGYTYGAFSVFDWRRNTGPFVVSTAVKSEVTGASVREILTEIDRMRLEAITEDELTLATSYLDGVFPIRYETTSAIAAALANMVVYKLPLDYYDTYRDHVRAVTTADVLRAAQAHLHPEDMRIVVVGNPDVVTDQLAEVTGLSVEVTRADEGTVTS